MEILVIKGNSQYSAMRMAADIIIDRWKENGHYVNVFDMTELLDIKKCDEDEVFCLLNNELLSEKYELVFSINGIAFNFEYNGKVVIDHIKGKALGYYVDIPTAHVSRIAGHNGKNIYASCIDRNHVELLKTYLPELGERIFFLPHRGFECDDIKKWDKRKIDVFFPGTYRSYENEIDTIKKFPKPIDEIGLDTLNFLLDNPKESYSKALEKTLIRKGYMLSKDEIFILMQDLYCVYRAYYEFYRVVVLETLLAAGVKVTVCGKGWGSFVSENPQNLEILPPFSMDEVIKKMGDSKIVLNVCPVLNNSSHERIFSAMLSKAVCLTDSNPYLESIFTNGEAEMYDITDIDTLPQKVFSILKDEKTSVSRTEAAYDLVYNNFRWQNLADEIITLMKE